MKYRIVIEPTAKHDMDVSYHWGVTVWGVTKTQHWMNRLLAAMGSLADFPERNPLALENDEFTQDIRQLTFHRYRILYTIQKKTVHILHVRGAYVSPEFSAEDDE